MKHVGALNSKPYSFTARPWELKKFSNIDVFDSLGSSLLIDVRDSEIMRITPQTNESLNEEWITDKTRFAFDIINKWRFVNPMFWYKNSFISINWWVVIKLFLTKFYNKSTFITLNIGNFLDIKNIILIKKLDILFNNTSINLAKRLSTFKCITTKSLKKKYINILNLNLRILNPIINLKLRRQSIKKYSIVTYIGSTINNTIYYKHLGLNFETIFNFLKGKLFLSKNNLKKNIFLTKQEKNMIFFSKNNYNVEILTKYHKNNIINALNILAKKRLKNNSTINYFLGHSFNYFFFKKSSFNILQTSHSFNKLFVKKMHLILPMNTWLEENNCYLNCFNFLQKTNKALYNKNRISSNDFIFKKIILIKDFIKNKSFIMEVGASNLRVFIQDLYGNYLKSYEKIRSLKRPLSNKNYDYYLSDMLFNLSSNMQKASEIIFLAKNDFLINN